MLRELESEKEKLIKDIEKNLARIEEINEILDLEYQNWDYHLKKSEGDNG